MDARKRLKGNSVGLTETQEQAEEMKHKYGNQERPLFKKEEKVPSAPKSFINLDKNIDEKD